MFQIGSHLSAAKGYLAMGKDALKMGANTFQFFTRNPRGGSARKMDAEDARALMLLAEENHFGPLVAHAPLHPERLFRREKDPSVREASNGG